MGVVVWMQLIVGNAGHDGDGDVDVEVADDGRIAAPDAARVTWIRQGGIDDNKATMMVSMMTWWNQDKAEKMWMLRS